MSCELTDCSNDAKYKCPACGCRTCSSKCISKHKSTMGCTGQRNKAAYIAPNEYSYGSLMADYAYLEDVNRTIGAVKKDHLQKPSRSNSTHWVKKASEMGISVSILHEGMERRKLNRTSYNSKSRQFQFTLTFSFRTLPNEKLGDLILHSVPGADEIQEALRKPLLDGRCGKTLEKSSLKMFKEAYQCKQLAYVTKKIKDPKRVAQNWEVPEKKLPPKPDFLPAKPSFSAFPDEEEILPAKRTAEDELTESSQKRAKFESTYRRLQSDQPLIHQLNGLTIIEWPIIDVWVVSQLDNAVSMGLLQIEDHSQGLLPSKEKEVLVEAALVPSNGLLGLGSYGSGSDTDDSDEDVAKALL